MKRPVQDLLSYPSALERVISEVSDREMGPESRPIAECLGRVLAEPIPNPHDLPQADNSAMDGYCLRSTDVRKAALEDPVELPVFMHIDAGTPPERLPPGHAAYIATGGLIPPGADTVLKIEEARISRNGKLLSVERPIPRGCFVRPRGKDLKAGETLLEPGTVLGAIGLGMLGSAGRMVVRVSRRPTVALLTSGNELLMPFEAPKPWQVRNSNSLILGAQVTEAGGAPVDLGIVRDDPDAALEFLSRAAETADVIITSGGISLGRKDPIIAALDKSRCRKVVQGVAIKPGKPFFFGFFKGKPLFGLPGNPASSAVTFELFVRPFLGRMLRKSSADRRRVFLPVFSSASNPTSRDNFLRAHLVNANGTTGGAILEKQDSHMLSSLLGCDLLLRHSAGAPPLTPGRVVEFMLLREP